MTLKEKVGNQIDIFLKERKDLFLISCKISSSNQIEIVLDGDSSVSIQDCLDCSRLIENNLDREEEDFELTVLSAGLTQPLIYPRQYKKYINKELKIVPEGSKDEIGKLIEVGEDLIIIEKVERRPKLVGKGKENIFVKKDIKFRDIKKATVVIKF